MGSLSQVRHSASLRMVWHAFCAPSLTQQVIVSYAWIENLTETLDYFPYGAVRISVSTSTNEKRKFIGQFSDDSGLSYLNARFYNPTQGQFISQDPVFWEIGLTNDGKQAITNPQALNSYAYGNDNPIVGKDPQGRCPWCVPFLIGGAAGGLGLYYGDVMQNRANGLTGLSAFAPRSSLQEYNAAIGTGAIAGATAVVSLPLAALVAVVGSGVQDRAGGRPVDPNKALLSGGLTLVTGGAFRGLLGDSPAAQWMSATGKSLNDVPTSILRNDLRYGIAGETFQSGFSSIVQNYGKNTNASGSRNGGGQGGQSSLPSTVSQGGISYVRNSSGLLNFAPAR